MPADSINPIGSQGPGPPNSAVQLAMSMASIAVDSNVGSPQAVPPREDSAKAKPIEKVVEEEAARLVISSGPVKGKGTAVPVSIEDAAKAFQEFLKNLPSDLQFRSDQDTGQIIFKVINPVTREVIRQYPPDEILAIARRLRGSGRTNGQGLLLDGQL